MTIIITLEGFSSKEPSKNDKAIEGHHKKKYHSIKAIGFRNQADLLDLLDGYETCMGLINYCSIERVV